MWFDELLGFREDAAKIYSQLSFENGQLLNKVHGGRLQCGELTTPLLSELRTAAIAQLPKLQGELVLAECVADVQSLHRDPANAGALFQVASQFNLLEMVSPDISPEHGISDYQYDRTQGPACAIACGAGTIYRHYFVEVAQQRGQSRARQLDMLNDLGVALGNSSSQYWRMQNGYVLPTPSGLAAVDQQLATCSEDALDDFRSRLRIGIQANTQVTLASCQHRVTQAYCSALPVAYCAFEPPQWARFASLVLDAAYEATLAAAVVNAATTGNNTVFLTLLGGGAFGNDTTWITRAILRAVQIYRDVGLKVMIVSYGSSKPEVRQLIADFEQYDNSICAHHSVHAL